MISLPFQAQATILIDAQAENIWPLLSHFDQWPTWSPWLCQEPQCPLTVEGQPAAKGHRQHWKGSYIGEGKMRIQEIRELHDIHYDLEFIKPWKSQSKVQIQLEAQDSRTLVTWSMQGTVPIFLFFMRQAMSKWISCDFQRGLSMLKQKVETGEVHNEISFPADQDIKSFNTVGIRKTLSYDLISEEMEELFEQLMPRAKAGEFGENPEALSIYHHFNMKKGTVDCTVGFTLADNSKAPKDLVEQRFPRHKAMRVDHRGDYQNLGNAWSALMSKQRHNKRRLLRKLAPYELYREYDEGAKRGLTQVHLPLKL